MTNRRDFIRLSAASLAALGVPWQAALAGSSKKHLKFIFVFNSGGWDPTRVFADVFENSDVDMEADAERATLGELTFVDHPDRPAVRSFFEAYSSQCTVVNGILVPSVAHETSRKLLLTGTTSDAQPDWPAILASVDAEAYSMPHMVVDGDAYAGSLAGVSTRVGTNGQLEGLLSGDVIDTVDVPTGRHSRLSEDILDSYMAQRASGAALGAREGRDAELRGAFASSWDRAREMKDLEHVLDWSGGGSLSDQLRLAVDALTLGLSRCVSVSLGNWDTHQDNDPGQSANFQFLFAELNTLMGRLRSQPGEVEATLADETVVMVMSEMGRTPQLNADMGKDHWPYTSAMFIGPGFQSGRVFGGLNAGYYGELIDPATAAITDKGVELSSASLGATLLTLADVDPGEFLPGYPALPGLLG